MSFAFAMSVLLIILLSIGGVLAVIGVFRPLLGLFMLIIIHFVQPGEMVPSLNAIRLELTYGVIIFLGFCFRALSQNHPPLLSDPILRSLAKFLLVAVLTIPGSFWIGGSINAWVDLVKIAIFVFLMKSLIEEPVQLKAMLWLQVLIMAWFAGSGLWSFTHGEAYELHYSLGTLERAQGINSMVGGPNELGGLLVALLPYLVALFRVVRNIAVRILLLGVGVISLSTIVLCGSRIGLISLLMVGLFYVARSKKKALSLLAVTSIVVGAWTFMPTAYKERYLSVKSYAEGGELDDSNQFRLRIWKAGERMFIDHPILGVGLGQFPTAFGMKYSGVAHGAWANPHNLLLQVACETGLIGLFFYANFLWQIFKANASLRSFDGEQGDTVQAVATACSATLLGVFVLSCVSHTMARPYWYFVAGLVAANTTVAGKVSRRSTGRTQGQSSELELGAELPLSKLDLLESPSSTEELWALRGME